jgi:hypothetical protein
MAHLLMIESWVGGTGRIFPATITGAGWQRISDEELAERYVAIAAETRSRQ